MELLDFQSSLISAKQLIFAGVKHKSCWSGDNTRSFVTPTWLTPPTTLQLTASSSFSLSNSSSVISHTVTSPLCPTVFPVLSLLYLLRFPFFSHFLLQHLFHFLSLNPLMSAHACCHIPPVQFSARQDWIKLNYAAVDRNGLNSTNLERLKGLGRNSRKVGVKTNLDFCYF